MSKGESEPLLGGGSPKKPIDGDADIHLVNVSPITQGPIVKPHCMKGWCSVLVVFLILTLALALLIALFFVRVLDRGYIFPVGSLNWWILTGILHTPYYFILFYLVLGFAERIGFLMIDCDGGQEDMNRIDLPEGKDVPHCCMQLAMFNEHEVSERIIEAACCVEWPREKFEVQVLDDSTDPILARRVDLCAERMRTQWGVNCYVRRRVNRKGYKAGALEEGRKETKAEFLALFDADFMPTKSFLKRAIPHFYERRGNELKPVVDLALVQAQWGHLNPYASYLTMCQALWVDDHHSVQMAWRSKVWNFVNFTGTAGVWRASAIEAAGGWRSASLVEDCELSFRTLFAGYRTKFVNSLVQPAELPDSVTAYKAQQKRWTQGWVQLWRLHFYHLLFIYRCSFIKRIALIYHMIIVWQWPIWSTWFFMFPFMVWFGCWFGELDSADKYFGWILFYTLPVLSWILGMSLLAAYKTRHTYPEPLGLCSFLRRSVGRIIPYMILGSGMLPHQLCSFMDGYLEDLHAEFERTPKKGDKSISSDLDKHFGDQKRAPGAAQAESAIAIDIDTKAIAAKNVENNKEQTGVKAPVKSLQARIHWYVYAELTFVVYQLFWIDLYIRYGEYFAAFVGLYQVTCMIILLAAYGDDREGDFYSMFNRFLNSCCGCCIRKEHPV